MRAHDVMTPNPAFCLIDDSVRRAAELMVQADCGAIPVVDRADGDRVVGIVTDRDIAVRVVAKGMAFDTPVRQVMSGPPVTVWAEADVLEVERLMGEQQLRRILVTDEARHLLGIVAQADLARAAEKDQIRGEQVAGVVERISEPSVMADREVRRTATPETPPPA